MKLTLITAAIATLIAFAAPAHASTPEDNYLAALARHGIGGDPQALIGAGHDVCDALNVAPIAMGVVMLKPDAEMYAQGLSGPQVAQSQRDAVNTFCPDKAWWRD
jgi:hypothetical protein